MNEKDKELGWAKKHPRAQIIKACQIECNKCRDSILEMLEQEDMTISEALCLAFLRGTYYGRVYGGDLLTLDATILQIREYETKKKGKK